MNFSKKQIIWASAVLIVTLASIYLLSDKEPAATSNTTTAKHGTIVQEVSVTGRVKAAGAVDLGFEKSGRIQGSYVKVGDHVNRGALLAELESSSAAATLLEAEARLAELKRGSRPEELAVKEAELAKYEQDLANTYDGILDIALDAFSKSDDALHAKMTGIFSGFKTTSYKFTYQVCDSQLENTVTTGKQQAEYDFDTWREEIATASSLPKTSMEQSALLSQTETRVETVKTFVENVSRTLTLDCTATNTALDTYRTNINTARTNINTVLATINTKKQTITSLIATVAKVANELALLKAGTASEVIAAQEARVLGARGDLQKYKIYAPENGIVTSVEARVGEFASAATTLISIIADSLFEIEAKVPEADIAKVHLGDRAKITLDAYGNDAIFEAEVVAIDPAETIVDNVPTYKVTLYFAKNDPRIKSGMTANIDIATARKDGVIAIPQRAVINRDGEKFVIVVGESATTSEVRVATGLRGSDGTIEVTEGLNEGDVIVVAPK